MFWHSSHTLDRRLYAGGLGLLLAVIIVAALFLTLLSVFERGGGAGFNLPREVAPGKSSLESVVKKYAEELTALRARVAVESDLVKALAEAEAAFLHVRVPASLLDAHFKAFLQIREWEKAPAAKEREALLKLLDSLLLVKQ